MYAASFCEWTTLPSSSHSSSINAISFLAFHLIQPGRIHVPFPSSGDLASWLLQGKSRGLIDKLSMCHVDRTHALSIDATGSAHSSCCTKSASTIQSQKSPVLHADEGEEDMLSDNNEEMKKDYISQFTDLPVNRFLGKLSVTMYATNYTNTATKHPKVFLQTMDASCRKCWITLFIASVQGCIGAT
ncbi:uncharacterized protein RAG0_02857 [Rhynchosporium agropyri]|uniref:Uncharacterized protein n=1 Tax=Rhynchosporium agropyri TaxID=914238 RepID=A0A1E1K3G3_9HELO|nr:uncharacterized protein RAG0_02857 [Rhynchosporium agropyri]